MEDELVKNYEGFKPRPFFLLDDFANKNLERCNSPEGFNVPVMEPLYWASALSEEAGEIVGALRKIERGFNGRELNKIKKKNPKIELTIDNWREMWLDMKKRDVAEEAADLMIQLFLFCQKMDIDIWKAVYSKFNEVSTELKVNIKLQKFDGLDQDFF